MVFEAELVVRVFAGDAAFGEVLSRAVCFFSGGFGGGGGFVRHLSILFCSARQDGDGESKKAKGNDTRVVDLTVED